MSTPTRTLAGTLTDAQGAPLAGHYVTFRLRPIALAGTGGYAATQGAVVTPKGVTLKTDEAGAFSIDLWPNDAGEEKTWYLCEIRETPRGRPLDRFPVALVEGEGESPPDLDLATARALASGPVVSAKTLASGFLDDLEQMLDTVDERVQSALTQGIPQWARDLYIAYKGEAPPVAATSPPVWGQVQPRTYPDDSGTFPYDVSIYASNADSFAIGAGAVAGFSVTETGIVFADTSALAAGVYAVPVRAINGFGDSQVNVQITVSSATNAAPTVASPIADVGGAAGDGSVVLDLDTVFSDPDGDALTYAFVGSPASGSLSGTRNRTLTISRAAAVTEAVTVRATDPGGLSVTDSFDVVVVAGGSAPTVASAADDLALTAP